MRYRLRTLLIVLVIASWQNHKAICQETVDTQEKNLASTLTGVLIWTKSRSEVLALTLPGMQSTVVHRTATKDSELHPTIHAIAGPDVKGRIAYIEDHFFGAVDKDRKHLLKTINVNGTGGTELFSRPGSAMWAASRAGRGEIGAHIALAPSGGKTAIVSGLLERQMPRALLSEGNLEIWNIAEKRRLKVTTKAINQPMSWFPDGVRLAYVRLVPRRELPARAAGMEKYGTYFGEVWDEIPCIHILDIETGKSSFLHVGWVPVVSLDGKAVLVGGWDNQSKFTWNHMDIERLVTKPISWPGEAGSAVAAPTETVVLYRSLPSADATKDLAENDNQTSPKSVLTVNVAVIESKEFQTVVSGIGANELVSFGRAVERN